MSLDVDFSLALNDRTGKLFLGRDIISALGDRVADVRYGRFGRFPVPDLMRRIAGRLTHDETRLRVNFPALSKALLRHDHANPVLHLDPLSVVRHRLKTQDIVLCHDVGPVTHPEHFAPGVERFYALAYDAIRAAKPHMVFVSRTSQAEFHALYCDKFASSTVIYIPLRPGMDDGPLRPVDGIPGRFLLTVGSIGDRKNQARCISAFAASCLAADGWSYVVAGGQEPGYDTVRALADQTPGIVMPGYIDDAQLRWLYCNAGGFVLMSLLEGFGMPVVEASHQGLACLVSDTGILAEIGGSAMLTADPLQLSSIAESMKELAAMPETERANRVAQTAEHVRQFDRDRILDQWCRLVDDLPRMAETAVWENNTCL